MRLVKHLDDNSEEGNNTLNFYFLGDYQNSAWYDPIGLNGFYEFIEAEPTAVSETGKLLCYFSKVYGFVSLSHTL